MATDKRRLLIAELRLLAQLAAEAQGQPIPRRTGMALSIQQRLSELQADIDALERELGP